MCCIIVGKALVQTTILVTCVFIQTFLVEKYERLYQVFLVPRSSKYLLRSGTFYDGLFFPQKRILSSLNDYKKAARSSVPSAAILFSTLL